MLTTTQNADVSGGMPRYSGRKSDIACTFMTNGGTVMSDRVINELADDPVSMTRRHFAALAMAGMLAAVSGAAAWANVSARESEPGDDHGGGGNGADDPPGDDRGSGGNGTDDPPGDDRGSSGGGNSADDPPGDDNGGQSGGGGVDDGAGDDRGRHRRRRRGRGRG